MNNAIDYKLYECLFCHQHISSGTPEVVTTMTAPICQHCLTTLTTLTATGQLDSLLAKRLYEKYHFKLEDL